MKDEIDVNGKTYVSTKRAARETGYTHDYVGQLTRAGSVPGKLVGRTKFVDIEALKEYKRQAETHKKKNAEVRSTKFKAGRLVPLSTSNNRTTYASREEMSREGSNKQGEDMLPESEHVGVRQASEEQKERQEVASVQSAPTEEEREPAGFEVLTKSLEEIGSQNKAPADKQKKSALLVRAAAIFTISFFVGVGSVHMLLSAPAAQNTIFSTAGAKENNAANIHNFLDRETHLLGYELAYIGAVMEHRFLSIGEDVNTLGRITLEEIRNAPQTITFGYEAYAGALKQFSRAVAQKQVAYVVLFQEKTASLTEQLMSSEVVFEQES